MAERNIAVMDSNKILKSLAQASCPGFVCSRFIGLRDYFLHRNSFYFHCCCCSNDIASFVHRDVDGRVQKISSRFGALWMDGSIP